LDEPIIRPDGFDLDQYIKSGAMGVLKSNVPVSLRLRCDRPALNHLTEAPIGADQVVTEIDAEIFELTVTVGDSEDLRWWLASQASYCDILEPQWLHDEIEETLYKGLQRSRKKGS
jgi:predicted DNA-binding transcriptional regulator YafY